METAGFQSLKGSLTTDIFVSLGINMDDLFQSLKGSLTTASKHRYAGKERVVSIP